MEKGYNEGKSKEKKNTKASFPTDIVSENFCFAIYKHIVIIYTNNKKTNVLYLFVQFFFYFIFCDIPTLKILANGEYTIFFVYNFKNKQLKKV